MKNTLRTRWFLLILLIFLASPVVRGEAKEGVDKDAFMKKVSALQMPFIENQGQIKDKSVRFYANTFAGTVFVTDKGEIVYSLIKTDPRPQTIDHRQKDKTPNLPTGQAGTEHRQNISELQTPDSITRAVALRESLERHKDSKIEGINKAETKVNYFKGAKENWRTNISTWQEVSLGEVYKGIELKLKAYGNNVEKFFTVHPKGSINDIKLKIQGAKQLTVNKDGELEIETEIGTVKFTKPVAYQEETVNGQHSGVSAQEQNITITERQYIEVAYVVKGNEYGFQVAQYDETKPLIIDPTLVYSTYLGGSGTIDFGQGIAVDSSGNMYVSGTTSSTDFPTASPLQGSNAGGNDIFVAKINASGSALLYATYIGGSLNDSGCGNIAIDSSGNAYITGYTYSADFPTVSPIQGSLAGDRDAFVAKIDASGSALIYSTYLGGSGYDYPCGWEIALDSSGNAYISGETTSTNFPTVSPIQGSNAGGYDAFAAKINASGSALVYSTYLGGSGTDAAWAITVDSSGNAYISGYTNSTNFPTASPIQGSNAGGYDAFVAKIDASGSALVYSTYLGGSNFEEGYCIAVDSSGNAYITGKTDSTNFPTASPIQASKAGGRDAFVAKINASGSALLYSTYLGGSGYDVGWGITADSSGNAYISGETTSTNFPTVSPIQEAMQGVTMPLPQR
ncbi:MAG: hypothetical protein A2W23_00015 [Planctomycetes bacterium RBG_16_43_13]|nr:MAG: hypothetical protein A2W23_00015 [Planctomycetes bacterium RBG_16_43_13]